MKKINKAFIILIVIFSIWTVVSLIYSISNLLTGDFCYSKECYDNFIKALTEYQSVYLGLVGLLTLYFGFHQVNEVIRQNREKKTQDTLNQVSHFYVEIQNNVKEFYLSIEDEKFNFFEVEFKVNDFSDKDLAEQNENWCLEYSKYEAINLKKNLVTLLLARLESFSCYVLYGNIDMELFKKLLGKEVKRQIEILYPFISSYRNRDKPETYYSGIIALYNRL